ncbi:MAG: hypothetical protein R2849_18765 [Thermomicrobiales bacterium]
MPRRSTGANRSLAADALKVRSLALMPKQDAAKGNGRKPNASSRSRRTSASRRRRRSSRSGSSLLIELRDKLSELNGTINDLRKVRSQVVAWMERSDDEDIRPRAGAQGSSSTSSKKSP